MNLIKTCLANKHTSTAAMVVAGVSILVGILSIWFPDYSDKLDQTAYYVKNSAMAYGLLMAGDQKKPEATP